MPEYNRIKRARPLLGTLVEITLEGKRDEKTLHTLAGAAFTEIERVHRLMSFHDPHSDISRLNTDGRGRPVPLHPWTIEVLRCAENLKNDTAGLFDVCIAGSLLHLGYLPGQAPRCRHCAASASSSSTTITRPGSTAVPMWTWAALPKASLWTRPWTSSAASVV
ncbi:FAD:protein FMN transferase [Verrucomicrobium spinosum]|uniref:FAD:protein FMN transferase n=1 Tax=Verrucomicrobium spinosum TaxID=2736 RepID=UPI00094687B5|nr:FAD:protein FMN transferase [Verrucomicrobium spinosum]